MLEIGFLGEKLSTNGEVEDSSEISHVSILATVSA